MRAHERRKTPCDASTESDEDAPSPPMRLPTLYSYTPTYNVSAEMPWPDDAGALAAPVDRADTICIGGASRTLVFDGSEGVGGLSGKIRATPDSRRVSVFDAISIFCEITNPHKAWRDLCSAHPEVRTLSTDFQFPAAARNPRPPWIGRAYACSSWCCPADGPRTRAGASPTSSSPTWTAPPDALRNRPRRCRP